MEVRAGDPARGEGRSEEAGARGTGAALESIKRVAAVTGAASGSLARPRGHRGGLFGLLRRREAVRGRGAASDGRPCAWDPTLPSHESGPGGAACGRLEETPRCRGS